MNLNSDSVIAITKTTDDTQTTAISYPFPQNCSALVTLRTVAVDSSQNTNIIEQRYAVKRQIGDCSLVSLPVTIVNSSDTSLLTASAALNVNAGSIELDITGVLLTGITWGTRLDILYLV